MGDGLIENTPYQKFSDYYTYCKTCKFKDVAETDDPCDECLRIPAREFTFKPINYKQKKED